VLVDVNDLYNVALSIYDFQLVLLVAQKSHKDPKEYVPFLRELKKMEKHFQRYKIDLYLRRYTKALYNLSLAGEKYTNEIISLIHEKKLYKEAVQIYERGGERQTEEDDDDGDRDGKKMDAKTATILKVAGENRLHQTLKELFS